VVSCGNDAEALEESCLRGVRFGDAAQVDLAMRFGREDDVVGLDASQFLKNRARRIPESRTALPYLKQAGVSPSR